MSTNRPEPEITHDKENLCNKCFLGSKSSSCDYELNFPANYIALNISVLIVLCYRQNSTSHPDLEPSLSKQSLGTILFERTSRHGSYAYTYLKHTCPKYCSQVLPGLNYLFTMQKCQKFLHCIKTCTCQASCMN